MACGGPLGRVVQIYDWPSTLYGRSTTPLQHEMDYNDSRLGPTRTPFADKETSTIGYTSKAYRMHFGDPQNGNFSHPLIFSVVKGSHIMKIGTHVWCMTSTSSESLHWNDWWYHQQLVVDLQIYRKLWCPALTTTFFRDLETCPLGCYLASWTRRCHHFHYLYAVLITILVPWEWVPLGYSRFTDIHIMWTT